MIPLAFALFPFPGQISVLWISSPLASQSSHRKRGCAGALSNKGDAVLLLSRCNLWAGMGPHARVIHWGILMRSGHQLVSLAFAYTAPKLHDFKQKAQKG